MTKLIINDYELRDARFKAAYYDGTPECLLEIIHEMAELNYEPESVIIPSVTPNSYIMWQDVCTSNIMPCTCPADIFEKMYKLQPLTVRYKVKVPRGTLVPYNVLTGLMKSLNLRSYEIKCESYIYAEVLYKSVSRFWVARDEIQIDCDEDAPFVDDIHNALHTELELVGCADYEIIKHFVKTLH